MREAGREVEMRWATRVCWLVLLDSLGQRNLLIWKADVKSAYRRVPVRPGQRWMLWVAVWVDSEFIAARHNAMPFG